LDVKKFVPLTAPKITTPNDSWIISSTELDPNIAGGQDLAALATSQVNLGNEWQGPQ
jgi:hypothetical protein